MEEIIKELKQENSSKLKNVSLQNSCQAKQMKKTHMEIDKSFLKFQNTKND